jgi:hypothetical protein
MVEMEKAMSHLREISSDTGKDVDTGDSAIPPKRRTYSCLLNHQVVITQSGIKTLFGVIDLVMAKRKHSRTTSIYLGLPRWLYARRYEIRLRNSYQGWDKVFDHIKWYHSMLQFFSTVFLVMWKAYESYSQLALLHHSR